MSLKKINRLFFYLLVLFLPTQLGYHFWPSWSMVLGRRIDYLSPTLFFTDILIVLLLIFWLRKLLVWPTIFFIVLAGLNILFSFNQMVAIYHWIKFAEFILLGYYIIQAKPNTQHVAYCLMLSVLYSSVIAIFQFVLQHSIGGLFWFLGERTFRVDTPGIAAIAIQGKEYLRAYATFPHPNVLGGFLAVLLPFIVQVSSKKKIFFWTTILFGSIALALTFSRSAWVVFLLGIGWMIFQKKRFLFFVLISCLLFLVSFLFSSLDESVVVRQRLNASAIFMFQSFPLFGVGLGNFLVALPDNLVSRSIYFLQPVHNIYLLLIAEIGVIGVIGVLWVMRKRIKFTWPLIGLILLGLVDHYPLTLQQGQLLLTLVIALSYRGNR